MKPKPGEAGRELEERPATPTPAVTALSSAAGAGEHLSSLPSAAPGARPGLGLWYTRRRRGDEPNTPSSHGSAA